MSAVSMTDTLRTVEKIRTARISRYLLMLSWYGAGGLTGAAGFIVAA
jgi:hypothetical protein